MKKYNVILLVVVIYFGLMIDVQSRRLANLESALKSIQKKTEKIDPMESRLAALEPLPDQVRRLEAREAIFKGLNVRLTNLERKIPYNSHKLSLVDTNTLFAYYPLDDDSGDVIVDKGSGRNNGLLLGGTILDMRVLGTAGKALKLNGSNQCINIDNLQKVIGRDAVGSIAFWAKNDNPLGGVLLSFGNYTDTQQFIIVRDPNISKRIWVGFKGRLKTSWYLYFDKEIPENRWWHFAVVQDGIDARVYINGQMVRPMGFTPENNHAAWFADYPGLNNGRIGARNGAGHGDDNYYKGSIDEVRYYRRALLPIEVKSIYEKGLVHQWVSFDKSER